MAHRTNVFGTVGIVAFLIFSSLMIITPLTVVDTASAWTPPAGTKIWNATEDGLASVAANWKPASAPTTGETVIFNETSVENCTWDLEVSLDNFTIENTFTGWVNQTVDFSVSNYSQAGGTYSADWSTAPELTVAANYTITDGTLNSGRVLIVMTGDGGHIYTTPYVVPRGIAVSGNVTVSSAYSSMAMRSLAVDADCTFNIYNITLTNTLYDTGWSYSNKGQITTTGSGRIGFASASLQTRTVTLGNISCDADMVAIVSTSAPAVVNLGGIANLTGNLTLDSQHATHTLTVNQASYLMNATQITIESNAVLNASNAINANVTVLLEGVLTNGADCVVDGSVDLINGSLTGTAYALTVTEYVTNAFGRMIQGTGTWRFGAYAQNGNTSVFYQNATLEVLGDFTVAQVALDFSERETVITSDDWLGPGNGFAVAENGDWLYFVRNGSSHAEAGDYANMDLYRSEDAGGNWTLEATLLNYTDLDVRNYAAGTTQTGRVIVVFGTLDCDNYTAYYSPITCHYIYSDDDGATWSSVYDMPSSTTGGYADDSISPYGDVVVSGSRIGVALYGGNNSQNSSMVKWFYSDDDGATWACSDISEITYYGDTDGRITETEVIDIGSDRLIALSRVNNYGYALMHTSNDAGGNWTERGYVETMNYVSPHKMFLFEHQSIDYILSITYYSICLYSVAPAEDVYRIGPDAFPVAENITGGWPSDVGKYGVGTFDMDNATIYVLSSYEGDCLVKSQRITMNDTVSQTWFSGGTVIMLGADTGLTTITGNNPDGLTISANGVTVSVPDGVINGTVTVSATRWTMVFSDNPAASITYHIIGLSSEYGYQVYRDGQVIATGTGPSFTFTVAGGGDFEIQIWYGRTVSSLVLLTVDMVALGVVVSIISGLVIPIANSMKRDGKRVRLEDVTGKLIRTVVFVVVALIMWGFMRTVVLG